MTPFIQFLRRLERICILAGVLLLASVFGGCASVSTDGRAPLPTGNAEIVVTNLTSNPWRLAMRAPNASDAIRVDIKPRETFTMTLPGGEYVVEQTLVAPAAPASLAANTRQFTAQFDVGERYRWSLATLLAADDGVAP